jgi:hypothetical protein
MLIGTKMDLVVPPETSPKEGIPFMTTSAQDGTNVIKVFQTMTKNILGKIRKG